MHRDTNTQTTQHACKSGEYIEWQTHTKHACTSHESIKEQIHRQTNSPGRAINAWSYILTKHACIYLKFMPQSCIITTC